MSMGMGFSIQYFTCRSSRQTTWPIRSGQNAINAKSRSSPSFTFSPTWMQQRSPDCWRERWNTGRKCLNGLLAGLPLKSTPTTMPSLTGRAASSAAKSSSASSNVPERSVDSTRRTMIRSPLGVRVVRCHVPPPLPPPLPPPHAPLPHTASSSPQSDPSHCSTRSRLPLHFTRNTQNGEKIVEGTVEETEIQSNMQLNYDRNAGEEGGQCERSSCSCGLI